MAPNRLPQRVPTLKPDTVWVANITYVFTEEGWLYVAGVLDRCTRRCIGWAMGDTLATTLPLATAGVIPSMRRKGNCYDNATMKSFWSNLKRGWRQHHFIPRSEARAVIFEGIEAFYNRLRCHSALGYQSPVDFETHLN